MTLSETIAIISPSVDQLQATPVASSETDAIIGPLYYPSVDPLQATPACGLKWDCCYHWPLRLPGFTRYTIALCHFTHEQYTNVTIELINWDIYCHDTGDWPTHSSWGSQPTSDNASSTPLNTAVTLNTGINSSKNRNSSKPTKNDSNKPKQRKNLILLSGKLHCIRRSQGKSNNSSLLC